MVVVACVAILVVGPKDLPGMLRAFGKTMSSLRRMAGDFQRQFNDALNESELNELKNLTSPSNFAPLDDAKKSMENYQKSVEASTKEKQAEKATAKTAKAKTVKKTAKPASKPAKSKVQKAAKSPVSKASRSATPKTAKSKS